jgi:putative membrane protein insertion efficiency factor
VPGDPDLALTAPQRGALLLLRGYKLLFSPLFAGSCRFVPSCSQYAAEAIAGHGVLRGSWLALRRLSRCRPFGGHGADPVPGLAHPGPAEAGPYRCNSQPNQPAS